MDDRTQAIIHHFTTSLTALGQVRPAKKCEQYLVVPNDALKTIW